MEISTAMIGLVVYRYGARFVQKNPLEKPFLEGACWIPRCQKVSYALKC